MMLSKRLRSSNEQPVPQIVTTFTLDNRAKEKEKEKKKTQYS